MSMGWCYHCGTEIKTVEEHAAHRCPTETISGLMVTESECRERERKAFVQGAQWFTEEREPPFTDGEYEFVEAEARRRYGEGSQD